MPAFWPGSLNLWTDAPVDWTLPRKVTANGYVGEFCPVVILERAIGVAFRGNGETPTKVEVLSPVELRPRLGLGVSGQRLQVRLLSGELLAAAV